MVDRCGLVEKSNVFRSSSPLEILNDYQLAVTGSRCAWPGKPLSPCARFKTVETKTPLIVFFRCNRGLSLNLQLRKSFLGAKLRCFLEILIGFLNLSISRKTTCFKIKKNKKLLTITRVGNPGLFACFQAAFSFIEFVFFGCIVYLNRYFVSSSFSNGRKKCKETKV